MKLKIITELLFVAPFILALTAGFYLYSAIIALSIVSALFYHFSKEKRFFVIDVVVSVGLIMTNLYFVYLSGFKYPYFYLAIIALVFSFYYWMRAQKSNYDFNHSMWHIASVMITLFCVLANV
ncbi:MAG: hypothetical protein WCT36_03475 [Candidatus Gracilibacteria bacterium]|jgi:hypothetical protein